MLFIYFPTIGGDWLGDDLLLVVQKDCARDFGDLWAILTHDAGRCNYRPMRFVSYTLDHIVWGLEPLGYHLTSLWLHLLASGLVFGLLRKMGVGRTWSFFGCAVFAFHPVQVDSVGYISGRRDVLMGLLYFAGVFFAGRGLRPSLSAIRRAVWLVAALGAMALAVLTKEMAVTMIATVGALVLIGGFSGLRGGRSPLAGLLERLRGYAWFIVPAMGICLAMIAYRGFLKPISTVADQLWGGSLSTHLATILAVHAKYVELIFVPIRLAGDYSPPAMMVPDSLLAVMPLAGLVWLAALLTGAAWSFRRGWYREAFGIGWYLVTMLPVSQIIAHHEMVAEHYLYVPLFGLVLAGASLLERVAERESGTPTRRRPIVLGALAILVALGVRSHLRSYDYQSERDNAQATVRWYPESVRGQTRLGIELLNTEGLAAARPHLEFVLGTEFQGSARLDVLRVLGRYYARNGKPRLARKLLEEYTQYHPDDRNGLEPLASVYLELNQAQGALSVAQRLLAGQPKVARFHYLAAVALHRLQKADAAKRHIQQALAIREDRLDSLLFAANLYGADSRSTARGYLERAKEIAGQSEEFDDHKKRLIEELDRRLSTPTTSD
ncbi:MAG: hypothetical protein ACLFVJ_00125 [Persicimonas sp.]